MLKLIVTAGPDKGLAFSAEDGQTIQIGRSQAATHRLTDPAVSRVHCEIEAAGDKFVLHNISTNGTQVNGEATTERPLKHDDVIRIGNSELRVVADVGEATTAMVPPPAAGDLSNLVGKPLARYQ